MTVSIIKIPSAEQTGARVTYFLSVFIIEIFSAEKQTKQVASVNIIVENNTGNYGIYIYTTEDFPETNAILSTFTVSDSDIKG